MFIYTYVFIYMYVTACVSEENASLKCPAECGARSGSFESTEKAAGQGEAQEAWKNQRTHR